MENTVAPSSSHCNFLATCVKKKETNQLTDTRMSDTSVTSVEQKPCPLGLRVCWTVYFISTSLVYSCLTRVLKRTC